MAGEAISVVRVRDVLLVTMPSEPDDATVLRLQESVLSAMERYRTSGVVLDISAVQTMDSYFAQTVAETAQMVHLMGGRTIIAGMRPGVAIAATELGLSMGATETALNVDRAFDKLGDLDHKP